MKKPGLGQDVLGVGSKRKSGKKWGLGLGEGFSRRGKGHKGVLVTPKETPTDNKTDAQWKHDCKTREWNQLARKTRAPWRFLGL